MCDKWSDRQNRIYEGLSSIGQEIAGFYDAGLKIYYGDCPNGAYFLLHAAREIDGGLRDILSVDYSPSRDDQDKHKKSILFSLGTSEFEGLADDWFKISKELHRYAHRHGAWKTPRQIGEVKPTWEQFENVLERLVGSYYAIIERIERFGAIRNIQGGVVETLCNILTIPTYYNYFFRKERDLKWFNSLKDKGYFCPEQIKYDQQGNASFWNVLDYLERVSEQVSQNLQCGKELIDIIESIVQFSLNKKRINNYHIWWYCVKILNNLPPSAIKENLTIELFRAWLSVWTDHSMGSDLTISDIGEKLLPKFLQDDFAPDYIYAETIINVITAIRAGGKSHAFTKRDDAVLAWDSYWIRDAFKKHGQLIGQKCSLKVVFGLADRLRIALEYKQKDHYTDLEIGNDIYRIRVERVPVDGLKPGEIKFKDEEYGGLVKQFSKEQLEGVDRENDFWALHNLEPQDERGRFTFTALTKDSFVAGIKKNLPEGINWQGVEKFEKKLLGIHEGLFSDYSHIWCRTLKSGPEHGDGAEDVLTVVLRDVLLAKCDVNREAGRQVLNVFLSDSKYQFPIFRRFVLLCVDKFWADYFDLLDKLIEVVPTVLEESDLEVEMQDILQHHNASFSPGLKATLKELISKGPELTLLKVDDEYVGKSEKLTAHWKFQWLSPLRENPDFSAVYQDAKQKAEPKDGKPYEPERSAFKGGFGSVSHKSPIAKDDILQKPVYELIKFINEFQCAGFDQALFEGKPDKEGLAITLQAAVKDEPKKFTDELELFCRDGLYFYVYRILDGFQDAWKDGKILDWEKVLSFCLQYIQRPTFLEDTKSTDDQDKTGKYIRFVHRVVSLIEDGCRDDSRAFNVEYFDITEKIFDAIVPLLKGKKHPDTQRDALTYALNTTSGRTLMAYVSFSLRVARAMQKKRENWGRDKFERFLPIGIDGYIWFGCYLPQMKYLDSDYTVEKINLFAQKDSSDFEWQMFMEGYLTGSRVYRDLYDFMRPNYLKAIESTVFKGRTDDRLVEHICIGYLQLGEALAQNNEKGQLSLFWKMLNEADTPDKRSRWSEVAGFFWSISGKSLKKEEKEDQEEPSEDIKKKVAAFWEWTFNKQDLVKEKLGDSYGSFLSRMAELTIWFNTIDETKEKWLLLSAPYIEIQHRSAFFIEYLTKFDDEDSVKRIGKIFLKVLETATPTFRQEEIQLIVERLYRVGEKDAGVKADADNICNTYGRRGLHFLKELFYKNQK